ncbi:MAG: XdhC family protein [Planctomycetaceae bacterium]
MSLLEQLAQIGARGEACALATVVKTEGSAPGQPAMKMLVGAAGRRTGTIGGGHVEATVEAACRETLGGAPARILSFTLDDSLADEGGLICGGTVHILVERVEPPAAWASQAAALEGSGRRGVLLARIGSSVQREVLVGEQAAPWLRVEEPRLEEDRFVEPLFWPRCIVLGAGHVGRLVARIAADAGFLVLAVEDRQEQASRLEGARVVIAPLVEGLSSLDPGPDDYVVVVTRGHGLDLACCRAALQTPARYVGMLGSRKKAAIVRDALAREGIAAERLHAPIGLDLGATSAGEIAVSVVAQMILVRRMGRGDR